MPSSNAPATTLIALALCTSAWVGAAATLSSSAWAVPPDAEDADRRPSFVAVVVGIGAYENLPREVELDFARSDASTVASVLNGGGRYDHVFHLADRQATKAQIEETIRTRAAQHVGPDDVLMLYFVGHGVGADLGVPILLASDSTLENAQDDGLELTAFARDLASWTRAGSTIIITDAIHKNQLDGVYFYGPAADEWPPVGPNTLIISSSQAAQPAGDRVFGNAFADALAGAADENGDTRITAAELSEYLNTRLTGTGQRPVFAGTASDDLVIAQGVKPGTTASSTGGLDSGAIFGDYEVHAAKFVFRDGASPTVQCRNVPVRACDPICYVRNFKAGPCQLGAVIDGEEVKGMALALLPGKYECSLRPDKSLSCNPPSANPNGR